MSRLSAMRLPEGGVGWFSRKPPPSPVLAAPEAAALTAAYLHTRYLDPVFRYVSRRLPSRAEAEDVTADVFAAAFTALPRFRRDTDPYLWLLGIARRKLADAARRRRARPESPADVDDADAWGESDPDDSPEARLLRSERRRELWALVDGLKPEQREALLLQHLEGLTVAQIATVMGRSPAAVNSLLQRARAAAYERGRSYFLAESEVTK